MVVFTLPLVLSLPRVALLLLAMHQSNIKGAARRIACPQFTCKLGSLRYTVLSVATGCRLKLLSQDHLELTRVSKCKGQVPQAIGCITTMDLHVVS